KPGILTTVQDVGRLGWRRFGINPNGPMDPAAARIANVLVGNDDDTALLEMHFPAAEITFAEETLLSLCGGDFGAEIDGLAIAPWRTHLAEAGSTLRFTGKNSGERVYLAIRSGLSIPKWLGSASTNLNAEIGGLDGRALRAGDRVALARAGVHRVGGRLPAVSMSLLPHYSRFPTVRIIRGAEFEYLDDESRQALVAKNFAISNRSNRMGFRLTGEPLALGREREFISSAVCFGTVQLLPDGQLIVLMADQQTAGGYPRIAHVVSYDLPLLGQLGAGDKVAFHLIEQDEAEHLAVQFERELNFLRVACRFAIG
ncbi:MAG: biotin-dependent carboxyltransferase, partial [Acidobacteria bacterium]|nr:biotin-dependent carboxyltransferase [Acidobacteriota bacterium]